MILWNLWVAVPSQNQIWVEIVGVLVTGFNDFRRNGLEMGEKWEIKARNITWMERSWANFSSIALPGDDRKGRKTSKKILYPSHRTSPGILFVLSQHSFFEDMLSTPNSFSQKNDFQRDGKCIWKDRAQIVGRERGNLGTRQLEVQISQGGAVRKVWLIWAELNKLLTLLTSKTPVYFINHPVHR